MENEIGVKKVKATYKWSKWTISNLGGEPHLQKSFKDFGSLLDFACNENLLLIVGDWLAYGRNISLSKKPPKHISQEFWACFDNDIKLFEGHKNIDNSENIPFEEALLELKEQDRVNKHRRFHWTFMIFMIIMTIINFLTAIYL